MSWCPKCKEEYREGFFTCADCGTELINELPIEEKVEEKKEDFVETYENFKPVLVKSVEDGFEAELIHNLLDESGIKSYKKEIYNGFHIQYSGIYSVLGFEIYVDESDFEKARELIEAYTGKDQQEIECQPIEEIHIKPVYNINKLFRSVITFLMFIMLFVLVHFILNRLQG